MKKFLGEFKQFALKGNVMDLAVGVIIGAAFQAIVNSLVNDLLMPVIGLLTGGVNLSGLFLALDFQSYPSAEAANAAGVGTVNYGAFLQNVLNFLIIAFCVFLLVKAMNKLLHKEETVKEAARKCPYCKSVVEKDATRCPHCTSDIAGK